MGYRTVSAGVQVPKRIPRSPRHDVSSSYGETNRGSARSKEDGKHRLSDFGGALLVTEQARTLDYRELSVRERPRHLFRPCNGKERITISPDELNRNVDAPVQFGELTDVSDLEAAEYLDGGRTTVGQRVEWLEEELGELAIDQRGVHKDVAEHEPTSSNPWLPGNPAQSSAYSRQVPNGDERPEAPADAMGLFGIDEDHGLDARVPGQCVTGDQSSAVMPDDGHPVELKQLHDSSNRCDVLLHGQGRLVPESA